MKRILATLFALCLLLTLSTSAWAASSPELLTINVDLTTPGGRALVGTFVIQRQSSGSQESWSFNGMLDGRHFAATGMASERWDANGFGTIELTALSAPGVTLTSLPTRIATVSTGNGGLVTIAGVPLAISGPITPPGAGNATLLVTNAGIGARVIASLPNTASAAPFAVEMTVLVLVAFGVVLLLAGFHWLLADQNQPRLSRQPIPARRRAVLRRSLQQR